MTPQEQESIFHHLESLQKKDWKQLTLDEKKACKYTRHIQAYSFY